MNRFEKELTDALKATGRQFSLVRTRKRTKVFIDGYGFIGSYTPGKDGGVHHIKHRIEKMEKPNE